MFAEYDDYDALGLAELVRTKKVTSAELIEECIVRIERVNPRINAVIHTVYPRARAEAAAPQDGPFVGVPFLIKDLIQTIEGVPTRFGSRFYADFVGSVDSELYRRYRDAGLIMVGKTNTPEFGLLPVTEPETFGPTRTPWDLERTSGGSSGGAGAAVAAGIVPMAHGGDGGGSIRIPSSCCGLFGLKPTRGRTPKGPDASEHWNGFGIEHVLTKSVRDSAAALDAVAGVEPIAPYHPPHHEGTWLAETEREPGRLRIGFSTEPSMPADVHPDCVAAVHDVAKKLEALGHHVEEVRPGYEPMELARAFFTIVASNTAAEIADAERLRGRKATVRDFETATWLSAQMGRVFTGAEVIGAIRRLQRESRRLAVRFAGYDAILSPTMGLPPVKIGELKPKGLEAKFQDLVARSGSTLPLRLPGLLEQTLERVFGFAPFTMVANYTGQPSMNVPLHWNGAGLPIGTMLTGRFGEDATLLRLAAQLEKAHPWRDRRPPVHAAR